MELASEGAKPGVTLAETARNLFKISTVTAATFSPGSEPSGGDPEAAGSPGNLLSGTPPTGLTLEEIEVSQKERLKEREIRR